MQLALCGMLNPVKSYKVSMDIMLMLCQSIWHQDLIQIHLSQGFVLHLITLPVLDYFPLFIYIYNDIDIYCKYIEF